MKRFRKILLFCTFVFCITLAGGCEDAPAPVNNEEGTEDRTGLESEKLVSVKEARTQLDTLKGKTVNGIVFPENIVMPDTDEIPVLKVSPWYTNHDDVYVLEETLGHIWDSYKEVDWSRAEERKFPRSGDENYIGISKRDKSTGYRCSIDSDGLIFGNSLNSENPRVSSCIAEYDFEWDNPALSEDDAYELEDGKISVRDVVAYTESLFNDYLPEVEDGMFGYKVQHLYVIKDDDRECCDFSMVIGRCYKDTNICTTGSYGDGEGEYDVEHSGDQFLAVMRHKNTLDLVDTWKGLYNAEALTGSKEIISPLWAVRLIDKEIAHNGNMLLNKCGLLYVLVQDPVSGIYDDTRYLRPVWLFAQDGMPSALHDGFAKNIFDTAILVDALDGTLYYYGNGTASY